MQDQMVSSDPRAFAQRGNAMLRALLVAPALTLLSAQAMAGFAVYEAVGSAPSDIFAERDRFRADVGGGSTAGANGDFGGVRREINWDGVPAAFSDPNPLPANFFNVNSPRGAVFSTPGSGFLVSSNAGGATPALFGFPGDLQVFSPQKLFATVNSNVFDIHFFVPGSSIAATTSAFAAIFVDAEDGNPATATRMEFFDPHGALLFSRSTLAAANQGLSFLGGMADAGERIGRVRITMPNNFLVSNGVRDNENIDFVVMDDFLYATPVRIPLPDTLALTLLGLTPLLWRQRARSGVLPS